MINSARKWVRCKSLDILSMVDSDLDISPQAKGITVLLTHNISTIGLERFRNLVCELAEADTLVSYNDAVANIKTDSIDRLQFAFTFDDGFASNLEAAEILKDFGASGCFFVCPGFIDFDKRKREEMCRLKLKCEPLSFMGWDALERLQDAGHSIGNHTLTHDRLSAIEPEQMRNEIIQGRERLMEMLGVGDHFAWPYGRFPDIGPYAARTVYEAGHVSCASGVRGTHVASDAEFISDGPTCIHRENIDFDWPEGHVRWFLKSSKRRPVKRNASWAGSKALSTW